MNTEKPAMIYIWHIKEVKYQKKNYLRIFHVKVNYWVHGDVYKRQYKSLVTKKEYIDREKR